MEIIFYGWLADFCGKELLKAPLVGGRFKAQVNPVSATALCRERDRHVFACVQKVGEVRAELF